MKKLQEQLKMFLLQGLLVDHSIGYADNPTVAWITGP